MDAVVLATARRSSGVSATGLPRARRRARPRGRASRTFSPCKTEESLTGDFANASAAPAEPLFDSADSRLEFPGVTR